MEVTASCQNTTDTAELGASRTLEQLDRKFQYVLE